MSEEHDQKDLTCPVCQYPCYSTWDVCIECGAKLPTESKTKESKESIDQLVIKRYEIRVCGFDRYIYDTVKQAPADLLEIVKILNNLS